MTEADEKRLARIREGDYAGPVHNRTRADIAFLLRLLDERAAGGAALDAVREENARLERAFKRTDDTLSSIGLAMQFRTKTQFDLVTDHGLVENVKAMVARATRAESALAEARERVEELRRLLMRWAALWTAGNVDLDPVACIVANDTAAALTPKTS